MSEFTYKEGLYPSIPTLSADGRQRYPATGVSSNGREQFGPVSGDGAVPTGANEFSYNPNETVGERLLSIFGGFLRGIWDTSHTVARVDLKRPVKFRGVASERPSRDGAPRGAMYGGGTAGGPYGQGRGEGDYHPGGGPQSSRDWRRYPGNRGALPGGEYGDRGEDAGERQFRWTDAVQGQGARLKLMQIWDFPDKETGDPSLPYKLNFGMGANFDMDTSTLEPRMRISAGHVKLHALPVPAVEFQGRWPIGETNIAVHLRYRIPVRTIHRFWEEPGARLMVNLYNPLGTGVHLTPGGLEFDEQVLKIAKHTNLRVAATLAFPRQFPLEEGEQPVKIKVQRLGIKTRIS